MSGSAWSLSSWWGVSSPWPDVAPLFTGGVPAEEIPDADTNDLVGSFVSLQRGQSFLAWQKYQTAAELHARIVGTTPDPHALFLKDSFADCAARIAMALSISQQAAEKIINQALALRDRLPQIAERLRDGKISAELVATIISRTDLVDGHDYAEAVDAEIAAALDLHDGAWSRERVQDMVDRIVFRHDPDGVREHRRRALDARGVWVHDGKDGTSKFTATMAAENARIAMATVRALAATACEFDGRTKLQRASDATFALMTGTPFECQCGRAECTAQIPEPTATPQVDSKVIIHVIADESTVAGTADNAGFLAGHGVISDDHVRDLVARPDAVVTPLVPPGTQPNPDGTITLPAYLPSEPYRPSSALDLFVRIRDGYSVIPGSSVSSFDGDLDHVVEYDHQHPARGGQTTADNLNAKDRFGHLLKTFGEWVDDQYRDHTGRLRTEFTTPEGLIIPGDPEHLDVLFPGLLRIRFTAPAQGPPRTAVEPPIPPPRLQSRVSAKHARRQQERERNRKRRISEADD
ncbi:DUF222 domain-containing protein [Gordonia sp. SL306]|uniref:DUF222 domain-containing protein n=1 Tax=Gordonia sp. SL306 TaxID=2995145 RepID=UPI0022701FB4|nr:DUF222 domain-containing protein [Gordonia sp. SL306]WAC57238.1 DUF222 domain-containing protein [Gordonia sp. SL306]